MPLRRTSEHKILRARQRNGGNGGGNDNGQDGGDNNSAPPGGGGEITTSTTSTTSTSTSSRTTPTKTQPPPDNNDDEPTSTTSTTPTITRTTKTEERETETPTTTSTRPTETSDTLTTSRTSSLTSSLSSAQVKVATVTQQSSSFRSVTRAIATDAGGSTISGGPTSAAASGSLNTGAMVGGIAGGLVGAIILACIVAFFVRRWRNRAAADEFDAAQFRKSAMGLDADSRPPTMMFEQPRRGGHTVAPSISSAMNAGMAGAGAYHLPQDDHTQMQDPFQSHYADPQSEAAAAASHAAIQPRQQYTYGELYNSAAGYGHHGGADMDDNVRGAYSSEPHVEGSYNPEMYADYQAYSPDNINGGPAGYAVDGGAGAGYAGAHASASPRRGHDDAYGGI